MKAALFFILCVCTAFASGESKPEAAVRSRLEALLEKEPANVPALIGLGEIEYRARHLDEAEKLLRRATLAQPKSAPAWLALGVVTCDMGKLNASMAALAQAVWLEPGNAKAHSYLGVTLGRKGWRDGAEAEFQRALELDESLADVHFNLAVVYLQENPPLLELARRHYYRARDLGAAPDSLVEKQINGSKE